MKDFFNQAIADGLNELGYGVDIPNEKGEMKFGPECHEVCTIAEKLNALIESWPVVYVRPGPKMGFVASSLYLNERDTHKARLAFIEKIVKEPCKHEPSNLFLNDPRTYEAKCKHCGVKLVAEWRAK